MLVEKYRNEPGRFLAPLGMTGFIKDRQEEESVRHSERSLLPQIKLTIVIPNGSAVRRRNEESPSPITN
jgi:hypothetical protein